MYSKLLSILDNEKKAISKHKAYLGPISLNVGLRRRTINTINNENEVISKRLNEASCYIPKKDKLDKEFEKVVKYKRAVSTRKADGDAKLDPLIHKRRQFELATSTFSQNYDNLFLSASANRTKISPNRSMQLGFDEDYQEQLYSMTVKSHRLADAKRKLPFNVDNMS